MSRPRSEWYDPRDDVYFLPPALALRTRLTMVASSIKKARVMLFVRESSSQMPYGEREKERNTDGGEYRTMDDGM